MDFEQEKLKNALKELSENYLDEQVNNNKKIAFMNFSNDSFIRLSMKRSNIRNVTYTDCKIENTALTGSFFQYTHFVDSIINGNSFINCDFYSSEFYGKDMVTFTGNNFSQSNFTKCDFTFLKFMSNSFLQTLFNKCEFNNVCFQSSTLEGSCFTNCSFFNVDIGNVNIEFIELENSLLQNVVFPFYQFPYIIGAADYINDLEATISLRTGNRDIHIAEYRNQIKNLIYYYDDKSEYFPICNLQIAIGNIELAVRALLSGINIALDNLDFRMVRHLCRLAKHHQILDEIIIKKINKKFDSFLTQGEIPLEKINSCIIHLGEIHKLLLSGNKDEITLNLNVRTTIDKSNPDGIKYVNTLCNELNTVLATNHSNHNGFQVAIANHSPYEIVVEVLTNVSSIITISGFIWDVICHFRNKATKEDYSFKNEFSENFAEIDSEIYKDDINVHIELCKERLLKLKNTYSQKKMNNYIEEVVQQLQTEIEQLHDRDVVMFVKKNK